MVAAAAANPYYHQHHHGSTKAVASTTIRSSSSGSSSTTTLTDDGLLLLATAVGHHLEALDIEGASGVTDEGVLMVVHRCHRMRRLVLSCVTTITDRVPMALMDHNMPHLEVLYMDYCTGR